MVPTLPNDTVKTIKEERSSLNTWLPRSSVIVVVMIN
jgi:hypothetical protein